MSFSSISDLSNTKTRGVPAAHVAAGPPSSRSSPAPSQRGGATYSGGPLDEPQRPLAHLAAPHGSIWGPPTLAAPRPKAAGVPFSAHERAAFVQLGATALHETPTPFSSSAFGVDDFSQVPGPRSAYQPSERAPSTSGASSRSHSHTYYDMPSRFSPGFAASGTSSGAGALTALEAFFGQSFAPRQQAAALTCLRFGAEAARRKTLATRGDRLLKLLVATAEDLVEVYGVPFAPDASLIERDALLGAWAKPRLQRFVSCVGGSVAGEEMRAYAGCLKGLLYLLYRSNGEEGAVRAVLHIGLVGGAV